MKLIRPQVSKRLGRLKKHAEGQVEYRGKENTTCLGFFSVCARVFVCVIPVYAGLWGKKHRGALLTDSCHLTKALKVRYVQ